MGSQCHTGFIVKTKHCHHLASSNNLSNQHFLANIAFILSRHMSREFGDYFEENRERSELAKAGLDLGNVPRRTSTLWTRYQEAMEVKA